MNLPATSEKYPWEKKMEVVSRYMLLGNMRLISEQTQIPYETLISWKGQSWWPELVDTLKRQKKNKTNESLTEIIEQSVEVMKDRLENGDFVLNNKTGEVIRKPVGIREATTIANQLLARQAQLEELQAKLERSSDTVQETLTLLAKEFQKWNTKTKKDLPFVEVVEETNLALHDERKEGL